MGRQPFRRRIAFLTAGLCAGLLAGLPAAPVAAQVVAQVVAQAVVPFAAPVAASHDALAVAPVASSVASTAVASVAPTPPTSPTSPISPTLGLPVLAEPAAPLAELGRALFFERGLSRNGTLSCGMCHLPEQAFTANELRTSVGIEGVSLRRNAPSLFNVGFQQSLFHDGRAPSLEVQALMPLLDPDEMANRSLDEVVARAAAIPALRRRFALAFDDSRPTPERIALALAAYQRTLVAAGSAFDRWRYGGDEAALSMEAKRGFDVFVGQGCPACHSVGEREALFTDHRFHNTGTAWRTEERRRQDVEVELIPGVKARLTPGQLARIGVPDRPDLGRHEVSGAAGDLRAFRTPTLRNVARTGPYMHDGSLASLDQVVDHYVGGGSPADPAQDPRIRPLSLTTEDRQALLAFLGALTSPAVEALARPSR